MNIVIAIVIIIISNDDNDTIVIAVVFPDVLFHNFCFFFLGESNNHGRLFSL